jgi:hypothetical protein
LAALLCALTHKTRTLLLSDPKRYVRQRTDLAKDLAYNLIHRGQFQIRLTVDRREMMTRNSRQWFTVLCGAAAVLTVGCSSLKTPTTASVAVSAAAVENASGAGGAEFAPVEMNSAREKMALANKAMAAKNYKLAGEFAVQAQADAKLAQSKANSAKAQTAANALQDDIRVLREELDRTSK